MDFKTSVVTCLAKKYATCQGRASRSEYWYFVLFHMLLFIGISFVATFLPETIALILAFALLFGLLIPYFTVSVRRLHDVNKSGWFLLLLFIPLASLILLYFYIKKGDEGSNRFGELEE